MIFGGPYDVPEILTGPSFKGNPVIWGSLVFQRAPPVLQRAMLDRPAHRSVGSRMSSLLAQRILLKRTSSSHS